MTLWIFDTDHATLFQQGNPRIEQRVNQIDRKDIAITIVTVEEQMYGRLNRIRRATSADELILDNWYKVAQKADWSNLVEVQSVFPRLRSGGKFYSF